MLQAYNNDPELKDKFIKEIKWHAEQDAISQGTYGEVEYGEWKGCAVACSLRSLDKMSGKDLDESYSEHSRYEAELGIPEWLAHLEDTIFEGLPKEKAMEWPLKFAESIPVGANLEPVKWKFSAYLMQKNIERVLSLDISDELKEQVLSAIRQVLTLHENAINTISWDYSAAESAMLAAESTAWSAVESTAWSAWSAVWSARLAAESTAWSTAESAAESATWSTAHTKHSEKLLTLLKEA